MFLNGIFGRILAIYWLNKGINLGEQGKFDEAFEAFSKAVEIDPQYADAWGNMGVTLVNQGKYLEAIKAYDKALEIDPQNADVLDRKVFALKKLGKDNEAIQTYLRILDIGSGWKIGSSNPHVDAKSNKMGIEFGKRRKFDKAIYYFEKAIQAYPYDSNAWNNKGIALLEQGKYEEALSAYNEAINYNPWSIETWNNKGKALRLLGRTAEAEVAFAKGKELALAGLGIAIGRPDKIEEFEAIGQDALNTQNQKQNAIYCHDKGDIGCKSIQAKVMSKKIDPLMQALTLVTPENDLLRWADLNFQIGDALNQNSTGGRSEDIELAIDHYQNALKVFTREKFPEYWAAAQNNLAAAFKARTKGNYAENIEKAIEHCENALKVYRIQSYPFQWAAAQNNLAAAYNDRINGDHTENIEKAIEHCKNALKVYDLESYPLQWAIIQNNLAASYNRRNIEDIAENREKSIEYCENALKVYSIRSSPIEWAGSQYSLGRAYNDRIKGDRAENIERAIEHCENALKIFTREKSPEHWAITHNNLASAYNNRINGDHANNIEKAIEHCENALKVYDLASYPFHWAITQTELANAYKDRIRGNRSENIKLAINHYRNALKVFTPRTYPHQCRRTAGFLGDTLFKVEKWNEAIDSYVTSTEAAEILYKGSLFISGLEAELSSTGNDYHSLAFCLARNNRSQEAIVALERGRARILRRSLPIDKFTLHEIKKRDLKSYQILTEALELIRSLELVQRESEKSMWDRFDNESMRHEMAKANEMLERALEQIRQIPGYSDFLKEPCWADIQKAIVPGQALAYIFITAKGGLAMMIYHREGFSELQISQIELPSANDSVVSDLCRSWFKAYESWKWARKTGIGDEQAELNWHSEIENTTSSLWQLVMCEVISALPPFVDQLILVPMGDLAYLPLHAAWRIVEKQKRYALQDIPIAYAPSAISLIHAQKIVASLMKTATTFSLLAVDEPKPVKASALYSSYREVEAIKTFFQNSKILRHEQATKEALLGSLSKADVVHLACHGSANIGNPRETGVLMARDEILNVEELWGLRFKGARLATLSACETGVVGVMLPDEVLSLPSAFMLAGFGGVLASLWSIEDDSTADLMINFYKLWREPGIDETTKKALSPIEALCKAQESMSKTEKSFNWAAFYFTGV